MNRLATLSTNLTNLMDAASAVQHRDAILSVCHEAVAEIGDVSPLIHQALSRAVPDSALGVQIEELRDKLDDQYFDAQEKAEEKKAFGEYRGGDVRRR